MRFMLARIGSVMFWLAIILCAVMDFTTTILVCIIVVGIGLFWISATLAEQLTDDIDE